MTGKCTVCMTMRATVDDVRTKASNREQKLIQRFINQTFKAARSEPRWEEMRHQLRVLVAAHTAQRIANDNSKRDGKIDNLWDMTA